ncbi:hypothetical protein [Novosphingobium olei]|uniref:hypothetical protein n=1 Tax=Novosphingobium olei TaxID=2728851 RepID=UPI00308D257A|nr:hypothetical protein NSDW_11400 [Novosphingobium olei]
MKKLLTVALFAISAVAIPMTADAAPCKDAKGKFTKCPPAAAKAAAPAKVKQCRDAKGRFKKC